MPKRLTSAQILASWQKKFSAEARADSFAEFQRHLDYLDVNFPPQAMLNGTKLLVSTAAAYREMDGQATELFINQQKYRLAGERLSRYCLTFDFCGRGVGRILTDEKFSEIDFADLYDHPWHDFKVAGFQHVWISRLDGASMFEAERQEMEDHITNDLYFDNDESALNVDLYFFGLDDTVLLRVVDCEPEPELVA